MKKARTFEGIMLEWSDEITNNAPQRKIRGLTLKDFKLLKRS